jgi:hypothetical protein
LAITQSKVARPPVLGREGRVAQGVLAGDLEVLDAVQEQVHPRDG